MSATVEVVAFAIQAGVRLAKAGRQVYVEETADRAVTVPLPAGFESPLGKAREWVAVQREKDRPHYDAVYRDVDARLKGAAEGDRRAAEQEVIALYLHDLAVGRVPMPGVDREDLAGRLALAQYRQYGEKRPFPHPLQRVTGALVEIAIDWFVHVPGRLDRDTRHGRAVGAILEGLDGFDFQNTAWDGVVVGLFKTGLDVLADHPELVSGNDERRAVVTRVLKGVATTLQTRLEALPAEGDLDAVERLARTGRMAARSLLRNAAGALLDRPGILGINDEADQAVFNSVGTVLVDLLLGDTGEGGAWSFRDAAQRLGSRRSLDRLILSFLAAASEHPAFFRVEDEQLRAFVGRVLEGLYANHRDGTTFLDPDVFLEVAAVVFETGIRDLPLLLDLDAGDRALAVQAARLVYDLVTEVRGDGPPAFRDGFARSDVLGVFQRTLAVIAESPAWASKARSDATRALAILRAALGVVLEDRPAGVASLLASDRFDALLAALLESGFAAEIAGAAPEVLAALRTMIREAVVAHGVAGLERLFEAGVLRDLLAALVQERARLQALLAGPDAAREAAIAAVVRALFRVRSGAVLSVPELVHLLAEGGEPA